jgi:hypothetical protein
MTKIQELKNKNKKIKAANLRLISQMKTKQTKIKSSISYLPKGRNK